MMYTEEDTARFRQEIDIADPRVAQWLAVSGVTVELVKMKMEELAENGK